MEITYPRNVEVLETQNLRRNVGLSGRVRRVRKVLVRVFTPQPDLNYLSARLREDARIDEQELEISNAAKAPLIR